MDWLRLHPITLAAVCSVILVTVGILIAGGSFARSPSNSIRSWDTSETGRFFSGSIIQGEDTRARITADDIYDPLAELRQQEVGDVLIPSEARSGILITEGPVTEPLIYDASALEKLFSAIQSSAHIPTSIQQTDGEFGIDDVYAYLPFKQTLPTYTENSSATQTALYTYGNEAGATVETYSDRHMDQAAVLRRFVEDLGNETRAEEVRLLAEDLGAVGEELSRMEDVPQVIRSAHNRVAAGYQQLGVLLADVASAQNTTQLLEKITTYNAAADTFNQALVAHATVFSVSEVSFNESDPGRVFVFTPQ